MIIETQNAETPASQKRIPPRIALHMLDLKMLPAIDLNDEM
jgi:hypothetical protein